MDGWLQYYYYYYLKLLLDDSFENTAINLTGLGREIVENITLDVSISCF